MANECLAFKEEATKPYYKTKWTLILTSDGRRQQLAAFTQTPICWLCSLSRYDALRFRHENRREHLFRDKIFALHQRYFSFLHELRSRRRRSQIHQENVHTKDYSLSSVKLIFNFAIDFFRLPCAAKGIAASPSVAGHLIIKVLDRGKHPLQKIQLRGIPS